LSPLNLSFFETTPEEDMAYVVAVCRSASQCAVVRL
jgi:hypothetical protein